MNPECSLGMVDDWLNGYVKHEYRRRYLLKTTSRKYQYAVDRAQASACSCLDQRCRRRRSAPEETEETELFKGQRRMYFYFQFFSINNKDTIAQKLSAYFYLKVFLCITHSLTELTCFRRKTNLASIQALLAGGSGRRHMLFPLGQRAC